jgi:hypothetical protein
LRAESEKVRTAPRDGANREGEARIQAAGTRRRGRDDDRSLAAEFMVKKKKKKGRGGEKRRSDFSINRTALLRHNRTAATRGPFFSFGSGSESQGFERVVSVRS